MTAKKTASKKPKATTSKAKKKAPARKVIVVDKPRNSAAAPIDPRTGKPYKAPKLVRRKPLTREEKAALDHTKIRGNS